jgi:hypothetical protein
MAMLYSSCLEARIFAAWPSAKDAPITFVICSKKIIIRKILLTPTVADPLCLSQIRDFRPGSRVKKIPDLGFGAKKVYRIPDPDTQRRI